MIWIVFKYDFEISWSLCPWDPWNFGLLDLFPPRLPLHTSSHLLLSLPPTLLHWYGLVWGGEGGVSFDSGDWNWLLEIDRWPLYWKGMGGWLVYLDYNVSSGPFLSHEIEIGDGPGPELDNFSDLIWFLNGFIIDALLAWIKIHKLWL